MNENVESTFIICVFLAYLFTAGDPDLIDGIISYLECAKNE